MTLRQLAPMAPRVSIKDMADEVAGLITSGTIDPRIRRLDDGTVKIVLSKLFSVGFKRTVSSRRKRLVQYVAEQLAAAGWVQVGKDEFRRG